MLSALRSAARSLGKSPGFSVVAIGILALGIGASTAIFPIFYGLLAAVAAAACLLPARRATKVDPIVALRSE